MNENDRVVALVDMDCFYVQVEERSNPQNKGKPACVVQYKKWKGGGIIAVNYEARAKGVTKQMRGDEAREKCPEIILYRVPEQRGKADLTRYRDGGKEVIDVMCSFGVIVERASIDEAYLDLTAVVNKMVLDSLSPVCTTKPEELPNTHVVGWKVEETDVRGVESWLKSFSQDEFNEKNWKLALAAVLVEKMRLAVYEQTGFRCSAGIAANKMLAKLACGINKPNKQTVLPMDSVNEFFKSFPLKKVRHLGGKLGLALIEELNCTTMDDITKISERSLHQKFDQKTGSWLYWYSRGIDHEPVSSRHLPKSIGCNKNFMGVAALDSQEKIQHWLEELCSEVTERLEKDRETNHRTAKLLTLTVRLEGDIRPSSFTRSMALSSAYDKKRMASSCMAVMRKENMSKQPGVWSPVVTCLGVSASKFTDHQNASDSKISNFFTKKVDAAKTVEEDADILPVDDDSQFDKEEASVPYYEAEATSDSVPEKDEILSRNPIAGENSVSQNQTTINTLPITKKSGFFASHSVKNKEVANQTSCDSFSIQEIFPDLDCVDLETLALLPLNIQRKVREEIELRKGNKNLTEEGLVTCDKCNAKFLKQEMGEHQDYHVALELQKEMSANTSSSSGTSLPSNKSSPTKVRNNKRPHKETKKKKEDKGNKRTRTIESFFQSSS